MQIKIGQIYKVKPEFRGECQNFKCSGGEFIKFLTEGIYNFLDKNKEVLTNAICVCFKPEHLEPLEKTLYNLEIGDEVEKDSIKTKILGLIESDPENQVYVISNSKNNKSVWGIFTARELEEKNIKVVQPEPEEPIIEVEGMTQNVKEFLKIIKKGVKEMVEETSKVSIQEIINLKKAKNLCVYINRYGGCSGECGCNVFTYNQAIDDVLELLKNK